MIECHGLSVKVGTKTLLDNIALSLQPGKVHALLGANGAGKTTLLKCLSKDMVPSSGKIFWQGKDLQELSFETLAQQRAVLAQQIQLDFGFTVAEVIQLGFNLKHAQKSPGLVIFAKLFDLENQLNQNYLTLSGGEQQRAQLARVFAQLGETTVENLTGKWLLLDEWTTGLDLQHLTCLRHLIEHYVELGLSVVMVLHDVNLAAQMADECHLLQQSRLYVSGVTSKVLTVKNLNAVYGVKMAHHQTDNAAWWQVL